MASKSRLSRKHRKLRRKLKSSNGAEGQSWDPPWYLMMRRACDIHYIRTRVAITGIWILREISSPLLRKAPRGKYMSLARCILLHSQITCSATFVNFSSLVVVIASYTSFGSPFDVATYSHSILMSLACTVGLMAVLGYDITIVSMILPIILVSMGSAAGITY